MERPQLSVELRSEIRKGPARRLRASGRVPAIVYGRGVEPLKLSVSGRDLERVADSNQLIDLIGESQVEGHPVLLKEAQRDPVSQRFMHCDFYAVDTTRNLLVSVPVHLEGKPRGVELGGVLETLQREVEVRCLPTAIPSVLSADISELGIGDVLHAESLQLPEGVELHSETDTPLAHVIAARVEAETAEGGEEGAAAAPAEEESKAKADG